jgi:hypothetical protein
MELGLKVVGFKAASKLEAVALAGSSVQLYNPWTVRPEAEQ